MHGFGWYSKSLVSFLFLLATCPLAIQAQTPLTTIDMPQGGRIVYGTVDGITPQVTAMVRILRTMHQSCGERPQIGSVFKMRGTDSAGLFFTVVNHPAGNVQVAGLIIASQSAPGQAALVSDRADRFGQTVNPMLTKLFSVWHPGNVSDAFAPARGDSGAAPSPSAAEPSKSAHTAASAAHAGPAAKLHSVTAPDDSASISVPDGWQLDPHSGHGTIIVTGPRGEVLAANMMRNAVDPSSQWQRNFWRQGGSPPQGSVVYPYHGNLAKAFPDMFQAWRRASGLGPAKLQIDQIKSLPENSNLECVTATGQIDADGKGPQAINDMMCAIPPLDFGGYTIVLWHASLPVALAAEEHDTQLAMIGSYKQNQQVVNRQMAQQAQQKAASDQAIMQNAQQQIDRIHQIGAQATARYNATQAANDAQHASYWAQQDSNARQAQGFTNTFREQTVVRDVQEPDIHATVSNNTAAWLQQSFPSRVEEVPTSQYIKGQDY
jgi:hypothetical protein